MVEGSAVSEASQEEEITGAPDARMGDVGPVMPRMRGTWAGPPGCRIAPTAVEREILLGRTRNELDPGMMRKP